MEYTYTRRDTVSDSATGGNPLTFNTVGHCRWGCSRKLFLFWVHSRRQYNICPREKNIPDTRTCPGGSPKLGISVGTLKTSFFSHLWCPVTLTLTSLTITEPLTNHNRTLTWYTMYTMLIASSPMQMSSGGL